MKIKNIMPSTHGRESETVHGGGIFSAKNKGFSLVELVVVIAIMAVMIAVLAPALLQYTEKSRAEKDNSAMSEVVNAVQLAMADQDCYDEVVNYNTKGQVSCYIDTNKESNYEKVITKEAVGSDKAQYTFNNDARLLDETPYYAAGNMRGVTITFSPDAASTDFCYDLKTGVINKFVGQQTTLEALETFYNRVRQSVGDSITLSSQTYRNSDFTIFIKIGSTGGNQSSAQDAIQVYGQFSGTNLVADELISYDKASIFGDAASANIEFFKSPGINHSFEFEEGMTWADWVNSEYNTFEAGISPDGSVYIPDIGVAWSLSDTFDYNVDVQANDIISPNGDYMFSYFPEMS